MIYTAQRGSRANLILSLVFVIALLAGIVATVPLSWAALLEDVSVSEEDAPKSEEPTTDESPVEDESALADQETVQSGAETPGSIAGVAATSAPAVNSIFANCQAGEFYTISGDNDETFGRVALSGTGQGIDAWRDIATALAPPNTDPNDPRIRNTNSLGISTGGKTAYAIVKSAQSRVDGILTYDADASVPFSVVKPNGTYLDFPASRTTELRAGETAWPADDGLDKFVRAAVVGGAVHPTTGEFYFGGYERQRYRTGTTEANYRYFVRLNFVYYVYSPDTKQVRGHYVATLDSTDITELVVPGGAINPWGDKLYTSQAFHANGDIAFDHQGNLFLVTGLQAVVPKPDYSEWYTLPAYNQARIYTVDGTTIAKTVAQSAKLVGVYEGDDSIVLGSANGIVFTHDGRLMIGTHDKYIYLKHDGAAGWIRDTGPHNFPWLSNFGRSADLGNCEVPPTLTVKKNLPSGRFIVDDQFTLEIGPKGSPSATRTTTGTATGEQADRLGPVPVQEGDTYFLRELPAGKTSLANYRQEWACVDVGNGNAAVPVVVDSKNPSEATVTIPRPANPAAVECVVTNSAGSQYLTLVAELDDSLGGTPAALADWNLSYQSMVSGGMSGSGITAAPTVTKAKVAVDAYTLGVAKVPGASPAAEGYQPTEWSCQDASGAKRAIVGGAVSVNLSEHITCVVRFIQTPGSVNWAKNSEVPSELLEGSEWLLTGPGLPGGGLNVTDCVAGVCAVGNDSDSAAGKFRLDDLRWGDYALTEVKAPIGYVLEKTPRTFTISGDKLAVNLGGIANAKQRMPSLPNTGVSPVRVTAWVAGALALCGAGYALWRTRPQHR